MTKIRIRSSDIEWTDETGKLIFEEDFALALMLANEVVYTRSFWYKKHILKFPGDTQVTIDARWTSAESKLIDVVVNCSDIFERGAADSESLPFEQIEKLYRLWQAHHVWGPAQWCAIQRQRAPHPQIVQEMRADGAWSAEMEALPVNGEQP